MDVALRERNRDALRGGVARGVRVRILSASLRSNSHLAAHSTYRNHIHELIRDGATLNEARVDAHDRHL